MADDVLPDDGKIGAHESLYRRIRHDQIVPDGSGYRLSSGALRSSGGPLSVDIATLTTAAQVMDADPLHPFHVAVISAQVVRAEGCRIRHDSDESGNLAHAHIYGNGSDGSLSAGQASRIGKKATIILNPKIPTSGAPTE